MNKRKFYRIVITIICIFIISCSSPESRFEKVKELNTIAGYENFINKYPDNVLIEKAIILRDKIIFEKAIESNSVDELQLFIKKKTNSTYKDTALVELEILKKELNLFEKKNNVKDNIELMDILITYLNKFPNGRFRKESVAIIKTLQESIIDQYLTKAKNAIKNAKEKSKEIKTADVSIEEYCEAAQNYIKIADIYKVLNINSSSMYKKAAYCYYTATFRFQSLYMKEFGAAVNKITSETKYIINSIFQDDVKEESEEITKKILEQKTIVYKKSIECFENAGMEEHAKWMKKDDTFKIFGIDEDGNLLDKNQDIEIIIDDE